MKHTLSTSDITILKHIFHVAVKSAKTVQFCFKKGKQQSYITPKKDIYVTFELSSPIKFDYPIADVKTFLGEASWDLNSSEINDDIIILILPSENDDKDFKTKIVQELDYTLDDHKINQRLKKYKHLNIMGAKNKCIFRYQNHERSWWFNDGVYEEFPRGRCTRKFRYIIERKKIILLPQNLYKLILREDVIQFQARHLNYYFLSEVSWQRQSVKDWTDNHTMIDDEHLIAQFIKKGYMSERQHSD